MKSNTKLYQILFFFLVFLLINFCLLFLFGFIVEKFSLFSFLSIVETLPAFVLIGAILFFYVKTDNIFQIKKIKPFLFVAFIIFIIIYHELAFSSFYEKEEPLGLEGMCLKSIIFAVFIYPILEEILFRGILLNRMLKAKSSPFSAIIFTSFLFALGHIGYYLKPHFLFFAFIGGIIFGYAYQTTRSLWFVIFLHIFSNGISLLRL